MRNVGDYVHIANNHVSNTPWAYEVGAENCVRTQHITVTNNIAENSWYGDVVLGGYTATGYLEDTNILCDPGASSDVAEGHGYVENITMSNNNFMNTTLNPTPEEDNITLQFRIRKSVITEAGVVPINTDGNFTGDENSIRVE